MIEIHLNDNDTIYVVSVKDIVVASRVVHSLYPNAVTEKIAVVICQTPIANILARGFRGLGLRLIA